LTIEGTGFLVVVEGFSEDKLSISATLNSLLEVGKFGASRGIDNTDVILGTLGHVSEGLLSGGDAWILLIHGHAE
jgi:hypothetical protein